MSIECDISFKPKMLILVKKGMAEKAFKKNIIEGNMGKIKKQIQKGTVSFTKL